MDSVHETVLGTYLGTTYSRASFWRNGRLTVIPNSKGDTKIPASVAFTDALRLFGSTALAQDPLNTLINVKQLIGRSCGESLASDVVTVPAFNDAQRHSRMDACTFAGRKF